MTVCLLLTCICVCNSLQVTVCLLLTCICVQLAAGDRLPPTHLYLCVQLAAGDRLPPTHLYLCVQLAACDRLPPIHLYMCVCNSLQVTVCLLFTCICVQLAAGDTNYLCFQGLMIFIFHAVFNKKVSELCLQSLVIIFRALLGSNKQINIVVV